MALENLAAGDVESCFRILLTYYDKLYNKALDKRDQPKDLVTNLECSAVDAQMIADKITAHELLMK